MRFTKRLNYCGECGKKLKDIEEGGVKVRYCKKCKYYLPEKATHYCAFEDKEEPILLDNNKLANTKE